MANSEKLLEEVRASLKKHFPQHLPEDEREAAQLLERHVIDPSEDPGQWAPHAKAVIIAECIPLPSLAEVEDINSWMAASDELSGHFIEHINSAVAAVYEC